VDERPSPADPEFEQRLLPLGGVLVRLARRLLADPGEAADVLQTAIANAYRRRAQYESGTRFRAWIARFVVHACANANRRRQPFAGLDAEGWDRVPAPSPVEELEASELWLECLREPARVLEHLEGEIAGALQQLRAQERSALLLRALADLSCAEIGRVLDVPKGTVMAWLFRARLRVREHLARRAIDAREAPR